jgi:hypothetical protein
VIWKAGVFVFIGWFSIQAQDSTQIRKVMMAQRIHEEIKIDGKLKEPFWMSGDAAIDFIQTEPIPGKRATFNTEVRFAYDNNAVYVGARMFDPEPEKILHEFSLRDQVANADNFSVFFDPYQSGLNGFLFTVTASGVQLEAVVSNQNDDTNWNAVWESAIEIDSLGWVTEIRIPLSSLRFPSEDIQTWRVQFGREIRRFRESSYWSPIDPTISGWVQQSGNLEGISQISSPIRLSVTPYLSTYLNTVWNPQAAENKFSLGNAYSAGLDLKYGINDAFTLDMTLVPDFGQVISDKQVLNLSPFEVFFEENRPFFTEGTELFNKGRLFYSRRIGGRPIHYYDVQGRLKEGESIVSNPETSQLYNATKVSGRTGRGTGLGMFNALVGREEAVIRSADGSERTEMTNPLTNYNALVFDQNLPNNSYVSLMNTHVYRLGADYDANVTGGFFGFRTPGQTYGIEGSGALSRQLYSDNTSTGYTYNLSAGKVSGNWTYELLHGVESDKYNPNDMGFLYSPNEKYYGVTGSFVDYTPSNPALQQIRVSASSTYSRLFKPDVYSDYYITIDQFTMWKTRFAVGMNSRLEPFQTYDYFEPRTSDFSRFLTWPQNYSIGGFVSSDYRKPFAYDTRINWRWFDAEGRSQGTISFSPRVRFSDKLSVFPSSSVTLIYHEPGYVNRSLLPEPPEGVAIGDILFGRRNRLIVENAISGRFLFNSVMGLNLRIRHYWDRVEYNQFGPLSKDGFLQAILFDGKDGSGSPIFDRNVNIFNIDMQYNWRFAPGSDLVVVWKNQIYNSDVTLGRQYLDNLNGLFGSVQNNNFSVRFLYFLDYLYLFPRKDSV